MIAAIAQSQDAPDPGVCARCALSEPTCCRVEVGQEEHCFPLSEMEWDRILDFSGDKGSFVQESNTPPFVNNLKRLFPGEDALIDKLFPVHEHKFHLRLATRPDGACIFLRPQGCALPREARPYYCRLFPFWVQGSRLTMFTPPRCLAVRENRTLRRTLAALDMTQARARELHGRLRLAWGLPPQEGMDVIDESFSRYNKAKR
jgi:Fe-S-cluster containining protein